jgi:hypothetical protein
MASDIYRQRAVECERLAKKIPAEPESSSKLPRLGALHLFEIRLFQPG